MGLDLEKIRATADRVAASHGLDVVEIEFQGAGKFRELTVFVEKNAARRAEMKAMLEAGIAATPGHDFDSGRGGKFFRFSYCAALPDIEEAIRRLHGLHMKSGFTPS